MNISSYQHPERPCIKVTRVNGRGYEGRGRAAKGRRMAAGWPSFSLAHISDDSEAKQA